MSEQQRQHLSVLVDGEIDPTLAATTISAMESSPELKATWERYHLIGSALRGETIQPEYRQIASRVSARIAQEPVPLNPASRSDGRSSRFGPFVGVAVAASAAFLAVFAVPQLFDPEPQTDKPAVAQSATPAPAPQQFQPATHRLRWHLDKPALQSKLDHFLVNHHEYSRAAGIKGILPYATVVGYDAGR